MHRGDDKKTFKRFPARVQQDVARVLADYRNTAYSYSSVAAQPKNKYRTSWGVVCERETVGFLAGRSRYSLTRRPAVYTASLCSCFPAQRGRNMQTWAII